MKIFAGRPIERLRRLAVFARLTVGMPDYRRYVEHRCTHHPGEPIMSYEQFFRQRLEARYARGRTRCC